MLEILQTNLHTHSIMETEFVALDKAGEEAE